MATCAVGWWEQRGWDHRTKGSLLEWLVLIRKRWHQSGHLKTSVLQNTNVCYQFQSSVCFCSAEGADHMEDWGRRRRDNKKQKQNPVTLLNVKMFMLDVLFSGFAALWMHFARRHLYEPNYHRQWCFKNKVLMM